MSKQVELTESELEDIYYAGSFWKEGFGGSIVPNVFDYVAYGLAVAQRQREKQQEQ